MASFQDCQNSRKWRTEGKNFNSKARTAFFSKKKKEKKNFDFIKLFYQEIIDKDDELLNGLEKEYGGQVYQVVVTAVKEMNEYNPSGRYPISVLWNFGEKRRASLKESIAHILKSLKTKKRKRTWIIQFSQGKFNSIQSPVNTNSERVLYLFLLYFFSEIPNGWRIFTIPFGKYPLVNTPILFPFWSVKSIIVFKFKK